MVMAHGGAGGAVAEVLVFILPLVIFAILSRRAKRTREPEQGPGGHDETPQPPPAEGQG